MDQEFHSIKRLPPYVFAEVKAPKAEARGAGEDIVDFGMGNPDQPPPHVIEKLTEVAQDPRMRRYSASRGIPGLRRANAADYARRFGVEVDPEAETIVTPGSKEGLADLCQAITGPGDIILVPRPRYPIHAFGFIIAGAAIRAMPVAAGGGGRVRFALVGNEHRTRPAVRNIKGFFKSSESLLEEFEGRKLAS